MQHMRHIKFQTQQKLENAIFYDTLIENSVLRKADPNVLYKHDIIEYGI